MLKLTGMKNKPAQVRGMRRVTEILDACESLLGDKNYDDISIDDILAKSKVARGTLYHFFENRRAVFLSVMDRALMEIDEQADPKPGEDKLEFADYVFKVERRLQKVWQKHSRIVLFYERNKFSPDFKEHEREAKLRSIDVMAQQLQSRHPEIGSARARNISLAVLKAMYTGLDTAALMPSREATGFKREWRLMITAYIRSLDLS